MAVRIHIYLLLVMAYMFAIQNIENFMCMYAFVIMHEIAHMLVALILKMNVYEIELLPVGVNAKYKGENTKLKELLISLAGPIASFLFALMFENETFKIMNFSIATFNLIPIKPFDGGKIFENILKISLNEKIANKILNILSKIILNLLLIFSILIVIFSKNYYLVILIIYMICIIKEEARNARFNAAINYLQID
ncbi:MAG: M50 family metallopeptidase [Clostridia bacterium]|nr:M50 family metallopeptidase [Clostridia bacterium]